MSGDSTSEPTREEVDGLRGPVMLEFGASWCGHCRALQPTIDEIVSERPDVQYIWVEDGPGRPLGRSFRVKLWPNLVLMKDGQLVAQLARPEAGELRKAVEALVSGT